MTAGRPRWLDTVRARVDAAVPPYFEQFRPPEVVEHESAVLILFGPMGDGPHHGDHADPGSGLTGLAEADGVDVVLTERAAGLRAHPGQVSFPGGRIDPEDADAVAAALREGAEEVGLEPASVDVVAVLPRLFLSPSSNAVTPVVGWWRSPGRIRVVDEREVAAVVRAPLGDVLDPANRFTVRHPSGYEGPGFDLGGLFVWGFTAMLLSEVLDTAGLTRAWDRSVTRPIPAAVRSPVLDELAGRTPAHGIGR